MIGDKALCKICGAEFIKVRANHIYCSEACKKQASRMKDYRYPVEKKINPVDLKLLEALKNKKQEKYCSFACPLIENCPKKKGTEFEHVTSGAGRWRALKGC